MDSNVPDEKQLLANINATADDIDRWLKQINNTAIRINNILTQQANQYRYK